MSKKYTTQNGFTLLETVLVMSLISILTLSAAPALTSSQTSNLDGASRKLESDLRYAQNLAVKTGTTIGFRSLVGDAGYEVYNVSDNSIVSSPVDHTSMTEEFTSEGFAGITFNAATNIQFSKSGLPTYVTGGNTMNIKTVDNQMRAILVNSAGLINMQ